MDYIKELRAVTGHRPLVLAGTSVLLFRHDNGGEFLMHRRADNGQWSMPGGMIEPGESAEDSAIREVHEETGWRMSCPQLVTVVSGSDTYYRYPNGDEVFGVTVVFAALATSRDREGDASETTAFRWWPMDERLHEISPPTACMFRAPALSGGRLRGLLAAIRT